MIPENLAHLRERIAETAARCGRSPEAIKVVAVTKTVGADRIQEAVAAGQMFFGENYLQEASEKIGVLPPSLQWHFIGNLQSNKAKLAVALFDVIETVDRWRIAQALDRQAEMSNKTMSVLIQVNVGRETQKTGVQPEEAEALLHRIAQETRLRVLGLMAIPPYSDDPEQSRAYFKALHDLARHLAERRLFANNDKVELSMGMSHDYPIAIEEGSTIIRVGTALFGAR